MPDSRSKISQARVQRQPAEDGRCQISNKRYPKQELILGSSIRMPIVALIRKDHPDFDLEGYISIYELNKYRQEYIRGLVERDKGELDTLEDEVVKKLHASEILARNTEDEVSRQRTTGQRLADLIARFGGSWTFIICFFTFLAFWIALNVVVLVLRPFDPYPFILLNLILSCLAAIQAPIIMMSQNRLEAKDRIRAQHDYQVNLKAELEIRQLHEKLDHLIVVQMQRLLEIQQMQAEYMEEILSATETLLKGQK